MSKRKEGIKDLKLLGAAMAKMKVASELAQLIDKVPQMEQAVSDITNQSQQLPQNQSQQQAQLQKAQLFEQLAQQAQDGEQRARDFNNRT